MATRDLIGCDWANIVVACRAEKLGQVRSDYMSSLDSI